MKRSTKVSLAMALWSLTSGAGVLFFADVMDRGGHQNLATAGVMINGAQLFAAVFVMLVVALSEA